MPTSTWLPYDVAALRATGLDEASVTALADRGMPQDAYTMFVRDPDRELEPRELPECGHAVFLGQFDDGQHTYWARVDDNSVWLLRGYEDMPERPQRATRINSSVIGLQKVLGIWDSFIGSGAHEDDDGYEQLVENVLQRARDADPEAFEDEESWWSRVFEEIEFGSMAPE